MYLWKVNSLIDDFKTGTVTQNEEFKYMLLFTIAMILSSDPVLYIGTSYNYYDSLNSLLVIGISILGLFYCYKINASGDDKDFIVRVICLGVPVSIRFLAVFLPLSLIGGILEAVFILPEPLEEEAAENTPTLVIFIAVLMAVYYWYLAKKIKMVSSENT